MERRAVAAHSRATLPVFGGISGSTRTTWSGTCERLGAEARSRRGESSAIFGHQLDARRRQTVASPVEAAHATRSPLAPQSEGRNRRRRLWGSPLRRRGPRWPGTWTSRPSASRTAGTTPVHAEQRRVGEPDERARDGDRADRVSLREDDGPRRLRAELRGELHPRERRRQRRRRRSTGTTAPPVRSTRTTTRSRSSTTTRTRSSASTA